MSNEATLTDLMLETFRLNGRLLSAGDKLVGDLGLSSARWQVLGAIALSEVALSVPHIARNMGLTRQAVQRIADELEIDKLVQYGPNPHHRRSKLVLMTSKGRSAFDAAMRRQGPWARRLAKDFTNQKLMSALEVLRKLRTQLEGDEEN